MGRSLTGKQLGTGISQRKDGIYEARAVIRGHKIDIYNKSLTALRTEFAREKDRIASKKIEKKKSVMTLNEWWKEWFTNVKAPQLKNDICRDLYDRKVRNTILEQIGIKPINQITQMDLQMCMNELLKSYTVKTLREAYSAIRMCFDSALINHVIDENPCVGIIINKQEHFAERRILQHWEQDMFLDEIQTSYYKEAYMILLQTGMRIGEFTALTWDDIDFKKKCIHINKSMSTGYLDGKKILEVGLPKTNNSFREIPFFGTVEEELKSWKKKQDLTRQRLGERWRADPKFGNLVFTTSMGSEATRYVIERDLQTTCRRIQSKEDDLAAREHRAARQFKSFYPHAFRHTFATRCFEKGMAAPFVQRIMGHANYTMTVSYTHIDNELRENEISKGECFLA